MWAMIAAPASAGTWWSMPDGRVGIVACGAAIHPRRLRDAADLKEKFEPGAHNGATQLVVRGCRSAVA